MKPSKEEFSKLCHEIFGWDCEAVEGMVMSLADCAATMNDSDFLAMSHIEEKSNCPMRLLFVRGEEQVAVFEKLIDRLGEEVREHANSQH